MFSFLFSKMNSTLEKENSKSYELALGQQYVFGKLCVLRKREGPSSVLYVVHKGVRYYLQFKELKYLMLEGG